MLEKYEFINHTADIGIKVKGESLKDLFSNAGYAMFDILVEIKDVKPEENLTVKIPGGQIEDILANWLRELLLKFNIDGWVLKVFDVYRVDESGLEATVKGEKMDPLRHRLKTEIKAVTYHNLKVYKNGNIWKAQIIFDV